MQQSISNTFSRTTSPAGRLGRLMVVASGICLASVCYVGAKGSFWEYIADGSWLPGSSRPQMADGLPLAKTTKTTSVTDVVTNALAFKAMLTTAQQATLEQTYTTSLARKWSNLPCGSGCRNGIQFGTLTSAQLTAAMAVVQSALGTGTNNGYDEFHKNYIAEAYLHAYGGGSGYDTTLRWISFLNTPSETGAWMLQFGGHHYAANISFKDGHIIGATPFFQGLEPKSFTWGSDTYAPLDDEKDAFAAMLASLSSTDLASAKLSASFSDCVMIPGETNGGTSTFPAYNMGVSCGSLSSSQKSLVLDAIARYVDDVDATTAAAIMSAYSADIDDTYISWRGTGTAGTAGSFFVTNGDYVRISGPEVWVEFTCQNGVVVSGQIHYHTVWRDRAHDYGVDLTGPAIDGSTTSVANIVKSTSVSVYPNPASSQVTVNCGSAISGAKLLIISVATGQVVKAQEGLNGSSFSADISGIPSGAYVVKVIDQNTVYSSRFFKF